MIGPPTNNANYDQTDSLRGLGSFAPRTGFYCVHRLRLRDNWRPVKRTVPTGGRIQLSESHLMKVNYTRSAFLMALTAFAVGSSVAYAATLTGGYVVAGATELRPLAVAEVNGQMRLQFLAKRATDLPVPFALGDDGRLSLVNFKEVDADGGTEYVLPSPAAALVLKRGDREAIVQRGDKCSLNGVKIAGRAKVTCAD